MLRFISAVWHVQHLSIRAPSFWSTAGIRQADLRRGVETPVVHEQPKKEKKKNTYKIDEYNIDTFNQVSSLKNASERSPAVKLD